jgi:pimeloyl-ACP methyl ester carboxylesterase
VLDALRALRTLVTTGLSDKSVIVGHSQGGHAALSALALSPTYAPDLTIAGTATYSPLWFNEASWGVLLYLPSLFPIAQNNFVVATSIWYHYSHAEILDGPGGGLALITNDPTKSALVKNFFDNTCESDDLSVLNQLGTTASDFYDPTFASAVGAMAASGAACPTDPVKGPICQKWQARYAADRPALTGSAATTPILFVYGLDDTTIPPERSTCGMDTLTAQNNNVTFCIVPGEDHGGILKVKADYVNDWIAGVALGATPPALCTLHSRNDVANDAGAPIACAIPPPNN